MQNSARPYINASERVRFFNKLRWYRYSVGMGCRERTVATQHHNSSCYRSTKPWRSIPAVGKQAGSWCNAKEMSRVPIAGAHVTVLVENHLRLWRFAIERPKWPIEFLTSSYPSFLCMLSYLGRPATTSPLESSDPTSVVIVVCFHSSHLLQVNPLASQSPLIIRTGMLRVTGNDSSSRATC